MKTTVDVELACVRGGQNHSSHSTRTWGHARLSYTVSNASTTTEIMNQTTVVGRPRKIKRETDDLVGEI